MAEETAQPTEGQAEVSNVTTDDMGTPEVTPDQFLDAVGLDDEREPKEEPERKPEPEKPTPKSEETPPEKKEEKLPEVTKRKIKWQGQEVELDPDKEIELLQKGFDYTQKMQALAAERQQLTPHLGVVKAMEKDPALRQKIAEHLTGKPPEPAKPQFDDPIEQLKWEVRQETLKEVEKVFVKPVQQQQAALAHQQVLDHVKAQVQADPMYADVQEAIKKEVSALPPTIAANVYRTYDQNPKAYLEAYQLKRQQLAGKQKPPEGKKPQTAEPTKREEHAPILESARTAPTEAEARKHNDGLKALNKRARAGDLQALGELLLKGEMLKGIAD